MKTIQQIFVDHHDEFIKTAGYLSAAQRKALNAVCICRTGNAGQHVYECPDCREKHLADSSCGNRHCPVCQNDKAAQWVYRQQLKQLGCKYFMATFTVPRELHRIARRFPKEFYHALFRASSESLKLLKKDKRFVGCDTSGFFGILHTWGRQIQFHPHVHYVIPGGGLSRDLSRWCEPKGDFLVHVKALSKVFKGELYKQIDALGRLNYVPVNAWGKDWVVHCKCVGNGQNVLKYLGAYVFRVAISNARITEYDGQNVTFKYYKVGSKRVRYCTLPVLEFIRRYLRHVLPDGFMKVRHFGFLSSRSKVTIEYIRELISRFMDKLIELILPAPPEKPAPLLCKKCSGLMKWVGFTPPVRRKLSP
jgi:hypothetical protein